MLLLSSKFGKQKANLSEERTSDACLFLPVPDNMCRELFLFVFSLPEKRVEWGNGVGNGMANGVANGMENGVENGMANGVEKDASVSRIPSPLTNRRSCTRVALF